MPTAAGQRIADGTLATLTTPPAASPPGILVEPSERPGTQYGNDTQFKGIFVRHLHEFYRHIGRPADREFILRNARSIWENARNEQNEFGMRWTGPREPAELGPGHADRRRGPGRAAGWMKLGRAAR